MNRRIILAVLAAAIALGLTPARATDEHDYAKDEYAIIRDGLAPNKKMSLASHGDGEGGDENFHVGLTSEPAHRKLVCARRHRLPSTISTPVPMPIVPRGHRMYATSPSNFRSDRHVTGVEPLLLSKMAARV